MDSLTGLFDENILDVAKQISANAQWQRLVDLDYLLEEDFGPLETPAKQAALSKFRDDYNREGFIPDNLGLPFDSDKELTEGEAHLLRQLAGLEGQFTFQRLPELGEISLSSRIALMRLDQLGLGSGSNGLPFSAADMLHLDIAGSWLPGVFHSRLEILNAIGDVAVFVKKIWQQQFKQQIVYFKVAPENVPDQVPDLSNTFCASLRAEISENSSAYQEFKTNVIEPKHHPNYAFLEEQVNLDSNAKIVRFIQLSLKAYGHYPGAIDEDLGYVTFKAILDAIEILQSLEKNDIDQFGFVAALGGNYFAFNQSKYFRLLIELENDGTIHAEVGEENTELKDETDFYSQFKTQFEGLKKEKAEKVQAGMMIVAKSFVVPEGVSVYSKDTGGFWKNKFFNGIKHFFKMIKDFISDLFDKLAEMVEKPAYRVRHLVHVIFRKMGDAFHVLGDGIKFLFSNRKIWTKDEVSKQALLLTDYSLTFDATHVISPLATTEQIKSHNALLLETTGSLYFLLDFLGKVIHAVLLITTPMGWMQIGTIIIKIFRELKG